METLYHALNIALIIIGIIILVKILSAPIRWLFKLLINAVVGLVGLFAANLLLSTFFGVALEINVINVLVTGIFGIPGVAVLIALKFLL